MTSKKSKLSNGFSVIPPTEVLIRVVINILANETNGTISQEKLGSSRVTGSKSPTQVPVVAIGTRRKLRRLRSIRSKAGGHRVDGYMHRRVCGPHSVEVPPATAVVVTGRKNFTDKNCIRCAVSDITDADFLVKNATKHPG